MQTDTLTFLQNMPIFGGLREDTLKCILDLSSRVEVVAEGYFFHEDEPGKSMFVMLRGKAAILKTWKGREYLLRTSGPGDCFGEMSLIDLGPRSVSARAINDSVSLEVHASDLNKLYHKDPGQFALMQGNMGREVSRRLRVANQHLFEARVEAGAVDDQLHLP